MRDLVTSYTFDKTAGTVTFDDLVTVEHGKILSVWNATRGAKLYDPHTTGFSGTVAGNVLTLVDVSTSAMDDADTLLIFYEGVQSSALANQATLAAVLAALGQVATNTNQVNLSNAIGNAGDVVANTDTGTHPLIALTKRMLVHMSTLIAKDYATEATLGAVLTAIGNQLTPANIAGLSTSALQTSGNTILTNILAELGQKLESSDLAPLATSAKQDTGNNVLSDILAELRDDVLVTQMLWEDQDNSIFYREERVRSQDDGTITVVYTRLSDNTVVGSLPAGVTPVETSDVRTVLNERYRATVDGVGYTANDWLVCITILDTAGSGTVLNTFWYNLNTGSNIAAPPGGEVAAEATSLLSWISSLLTSQNQYIGVQNETAPATDTAMSGLNGRLQRIAQRLTTLITNVGTFVFGAGTAAAAQRVTIATDDGLHTKLGSLTETAPATDTASSGLNGRLQRIAQNITTLWGLLPATLSNGNMRVSIQESSATVTVKSPYAEDDPSVHRGEGFPMLAVRKASPADTSDADGDYEYLSVKDGKLHVRTTHDGALVAGSAVIGKVGIDQATPGTTNAVAPIAGQNGVAAGAGNVGATTQRMTLAADDPLITRVGEVQASPTANTVLGRLKDLLTGIVLSAGTAVIGQIFTSARTSKQLTNINLSFSSSGENSLVSGVASQKVRVFRGSMTAATAVTLTIKAASGGSTLATIPLAAGGTFSFDCMDSGEPLWETTAAGAFVVSLSSGVSVTGFLQYTQAV